MHLLLHATVHPLRTCLGPSSIHPNLEGVRWIEKLQLLEMLTSVTCLSLLMLKLLMLDDWESEGNKETYKKNFGCLKIVVKITSLICIHSRKRKREGTNYNVCYAKSKATFALLCTVY